MAQPDGRHRRPARGHAPALIRGGRGSAELEDPAEGAHGPAVAVEFQALKPGLALFVIGLLPAALQGIDIVRMLAGAAACDAATRVHDTRRNPAALMALMWYVATDGKGKKDLVVLPYKDRLLLFSRYLQQLVMESLGKQLDLDGRRVEQGIAVYGNKGSTDQHAYVQQLRDGVNNFFVTFVRVLESGGSPLEVEPGVTAGDYLHGFLVGTREALLQCAPDHVIDSFGELVDLV